MFQWLPLLAVLIGCGGRPAPPGPQVIFSRPQEIVKYVASDYLIWPRFSPDGQTIVFNARFADDAWDCLYLVSISGANLRQLYAADEGCYNPSFAADGRTVVFSKGHARRIHILDPAAPPAVPLPVFGLAAQLLPDGQTVLYSGVTDAKLYLYHIPSGQTRQLTLARQSRDRVPRLLADRRTVVWLADHQSGFSRLAHGRLDAFSEQTDIRLPEWFGSLSPAPSGRYFLLGRADGRPIVACPADSGLYPVTIQPLQGDSLTQTLALFPDWSPVGNRVVFIGQRYHQRTARHPFRYKSGCAGHLMVAELQWQGISDEAIYTRPAATSVPVFADPRPAPAAPIALPAEPQTNHPPVIYSYPPQTITLGDLYLYRAEAFDIDLFDNLRFTLRESPFNAELLTTSGVLLWLPDDTGTSTFTLMVTDPAGASDQQTFDVTVLPRPAWQDSAFAAARTLPDRVLRKRFWEKWQDSAFAAARNLPAGGDFSARLSFHDSYPDGFLTPSEEARIIIALSNNTSQPLDSLSLHLLSSTGYGEIEWHPHIGPVTCPVGQWVEFEIPIRGAARLRNRPILFRGYILNQTGVQIIPALLIINARNPQMP